MSREEKIAGFDPNGVGLVGEGLFGLPFTPEEAEVVIVPVPWEVTVSYSPGTADGPAAILAASPQLDLYDERIPDAWKTGIALDAISEKWAENSSKMREKAGIYIDFLENGGNPDQTPEMAAIRDQVNQSCADLHREVEAKCAEWLDQDKLVGILGGEHSVPLGLLRALSARHPEFGILQIDAHADLRDAYEGFTYSHASIMFNATNLLQINRLVSVGIRDYCEAEAKMYSARPDFVLYSDRALAARKFRGQGNWDAICKEIVANLPQKVYVSFDIDGLKPELCPHTGTPVPGGLDFAEAMYLLEVLKDSGREIIGFDLCEVAPGPEEDEWDANVGARVLYRLSNLASASRKSD